jgi:hypothetical protein
MKFTALYRSRVLNELDRPRLREGLMWSTSSVHTPTLVVLRLRMSLPEFEGQRKKTSIVDSKGW